MTSLLRRHRPTLTALAVASLIPAAVTSVSAANYFVVTPAPAARVVPAPVPELPIQIGLAAGPLPAAWAGLPFAHSFAPYVSVTGDPDFDSSAVILSAIGTPGGLTFGADGSLVGTPLTTGEMTFSVTARYQTKVAEQSYVLTVSKQLRQQGGVRAWSDGSLGSSCLDYLVDRPGQAYRGATGDGVYRIDVDGPGPLAPADVLCDMTTDGGGWTVFQVRRDGSVDFMRGWADYARGFGSAPGEYWLGNDRIAALTSQDSEMMIDMTRFSGAKATVRYNQFAVGAENTSYRLTATGYTGAIAVDALATHHGQPFTTIDRDNDGSAKFNCAETYTGAWWHKNCHNSNLNGLYLGLGEVEYGKGMVWSSLTGYRESLAATTMKLRSR